MSSTTQRPCERVELVATLAIDALPENEAQALREHIGSCAQCQRELAALRPTVDELVAWPTDLLRPSPTLRERLARRIAQETGREHELPAKQWSEPEWEEVAPGISCKLLASDPERDRVSMLVRLAPGVAYPPHTHAGVEELHLLEGELWIEDRLLKPGDYNFGPPGHSDQRVYSETGCMCVLITSPSDVLR